MKPEEKLVKLGNDYVVSIAKRDGVDPLALDKTIPRLNGWDVAFVLRDGIAYATACKGTVRHEAAIDVPDTFDVGSVRAVMIHAFGKLATKIVFDGKTVEDVMREIEEAHNIAD